MKTRHLILLWSIVLLLAIAVLLVKRSQQQETTAATQRQPGQTLFQDFPGNAITTIEIQGPNRTTTLVKSENSWGVVERDGYPAESAVVNQFLRTLAELKIIRTHEAGPSLAPRFGMDENATDPEEHGLTATFKDADGKTLAQITLGKNVDTGAKADPFGGGGGVSGRFIRDTADTSGFYAVNELFSEISDQPTQWLTPGFFSLLKIKSIRVSQPGKTDPDWSVSRPDETQPFTLDQPTEGESLPAEKSASLSTLFSYASFEDVIPASVVATRAQPETTRHITIETVEGFTYRLTLTFAKPVTAQDAAATPKLSVFLTVEVSADLPKERKKEDGETPEQAEEKDKAFTSRLKILEEKLAAEQKLHGHTYEIDSASVENLLISRSELTAAAAKP
ncbi:MAG: DUF4340 domain-containing protein [Luteolibacter sp.]